MDYVKDLEAALEHIDQAIRLLSEIDGMEQYVEELSIQAAAVEAEILELESLERFNSEPDPGEMVEWHDFDPDC